MRNPWFSILSGFARPLDGLEAILAQMAAGQMSQDEAARQIRELAARPHIPAWYPRLFRGIGLLFVVIGCGFTIYSLSFAFGTQKAQGIVIEMAGGSPIVEFTVAARKFKHHSTISTSPPSYSVGENVDVLYRPADPTNCQLDTFTDRWLFPVAFVCGGIIAMCSAAYLPKILDKFATGVK